jgi:transposase InsO family protein
VHTHWRRLARCSRRRQRALGKLTPVEFELAFASEEALAA